MNTIYVYDADHQFLEDEGRVCTIPGYLHGELDEHCTDLICVGVRSKLLREVVDFTTSNDKDKIIIPVTVESELFTDDIECSYFLWKTPIGVKGLVVKDDDLESYQDAEYKWSNLSLAI